MNLEFLFLFRAEGNSLYLSLSLSLVAHVSADIADTFYISGKLSLSARRLASRTHPHVFIAIISQRWRQSLRLCVCVCVSSTRPDNKKSYDFLYSSTTTSFCFRLMRPKKEPIATQVQRFLRLNRAAAQPERQRTRAVERQQPRNRFRFTSASFERTALF